MLMPEDLLFKDEDATNIDKALLENVIFQAKLKIPEWLELAESPYKWMKSLSRNFVSYYHKSMLTRLNEIENQEEDYELEKFTLLLTMFCMDTLQIEIKSDGKTDSSSEDKIDPKETYKDLEDIVEQMRSHEGDLMYTRIGPALEHLLTATRANMLHLVGRDDESIQISKKMVVVETMDLKSKAGLEGIKAKFLEHIYRKRHISLEAGKKAVDLDPDFPYWKYIIAKIMRRDRRSKRQDITKEELEYLETAIQTERNPKFLLWLAQVYQEMALQLPKRQSETIYHKAVKLYREIWSLKNDSAPIARRVGNGLLKIKSKFGDLKLAEEALLKSVEISPFFYSAHHALVKFYLFYSLDEEKALQYFNLVPKQFKSYPTGEIIRYKLVNGLKNDISEYVKHLVERAEGGDNSVCCDMAWYFLCFKQDVSRAVFFLWKVLKCNPESPRALKYSSYTFLVNGPYNLLEIVLNQILLTTEEDQENSEQCQNSEVIIKFLEKIYEKHPYLREYTPDPNLVPKIKREVDISRGNVYKFMNENKFFNTANDQGNVAGSGQTKDGQDVDQSSNGGRRNYGIDNWRALSDTRGRNKEHNDDDNNHSSWNRASNSSRDNRESSQDHDGSGITSWNTDRGTRRFTYGNREPNRDGYRSRHNSEHEQDENRRSYAQKRERNQRYNNSRYDTAVTNWRTENRQ